MMNEKQQQLEEQSIERRLMAFRIHNTASWCDPIHTAPEPYLELKTTFHNAAECEERNKLINIYARF